MSDPEKTKGQLAQELAEAHRRIAAFEAMADREQGNQTSPQSDERLRQVVRNMPVMMDAFDDHWNIIVWNRECERVSGYRADEIVGNPKGMDLLYPDAAYRQRMMAEWAQRGDDYRFWEWEIVAKDGSIKTVAWSNIARQFPISGWATWGIGIDLTERKRAEAAVWNEQCRLRRLLEMYERDRKLVAFEIHDGFVQPLAGALMTLEASLRLLREACPDAVHAGLDRTVELLRRSLDDARQLMGGLRPATLEHSGLVAALEHLVYEARSRESIEIEYEHDVRFDRLPAPLETALYRIAQESLNNACRHSQSSKVRIGLTHKGERAHLEVQDWGVGFDPATSKPDCFGLVGIRERARLFGGQAVIDSVPGKGTRIAVELPLVESGWSGTRDQLP